MAKRDARKINDASKALSGKANPLTGKIQIYTTKTGELLEVWPVDAAEHLAAGSGSLEKPEISVPAPAPAAPAPAPKKSIKKKPSDSDK